MFQPAVKYQAKLRLAVVGPSGAGKTWTSLAVASAIVPDSRVAVIDTEHGSASKYSPHFPPFDVLNMEPPFDPRRYVAAIREAEKLGYDVLIIDTISHAWNGPGGLLEIVEQASKKYRGNSFAGWKEGTPIQNDFVEAMVGANLHLIATMRSKTEYILQEKDGKQVPTKVGMAPVQRDQVEYNFDVVLELDIENSAVVTKTRCPALTGKVMARPGADLAAILADWLSGEPAPEKQAGESLPVANGRGLPAWLKGAERITLETVLEAADTRLGIDQVSAHELLQKHFELPEAAKGKFKWAPDQQLTSDGALAMYWWLEEQLMPDEPSPGDADAR